ncbi:MAG TPA: hypothetical protein VMM92_02585 [Thermoanaerobaculia bacterium]|nr:hypothetical protein [Thermoanaerobaculia bacterium]
MKRFLKPSTAIFTLLIGITAVAAANTPMPRPDSTERFSGALVNLNRGARFTQPFTLSVAHYSSEAELERLSEILATQGPYSLRDELWKLDAGYLRIGGGIGYPVAAVVSRETENGRTLRIFLNRPLRNREVAFNTRSSKYPFGYIELNLDRHDQGNGQMIAAAKLKKTGNTLEIESLGIQPVRLLDVRAN